tara:strand:+ start:2306 stop:2548 length:243 start_codon:yes stop_codon:yes gene_type:complete
MIHNLAWGKKHMKKPGYKTTEFWLSSICAICGILYASGMISPEGTTGIEKAVAFVASAMAALGYSASRGNVKAAEIENEK